MAAAAALTVSSLSAEVPELTQLVPEAKGYELIYKLNPLEYLRNGYQVDNGDSYSGTLKRIGYLLKYECRGRGYALEGARACMEP